MFHCSANSLITGLSNSLLQDKEVQLTCTIYLPPINMSMRTQAFPPLTLPYSLHEVTCHTRRRVWGGQGGCLHITKPTVPPIETFLNVKLSYLFSDKTILVANNVGHFVRIICSLTLQVPLKGFFYLTLQTFADYFSKLLSSLN